MKRVLSILMIVFVISIIMLCTNSNSSEGLHDITSSSTTQITSSSVQLIKQGNIINYQVTGTFTKSGIQSIFDMYVNPELSTSLTASYDYISYKVTYYSQGPIGYIRPCSSIVMLPLGTFSNNSLIMVACNHGTTGLGDNCTFSQYGMAGGAFSASLFIAEGYPVVMTDYVGLGTEGTHPYLILEAEAFSVIDGLRAMQSLSATTGVSQYLSNKTFIAGLSQGGHATLGAHQYMNTYGSEFAPLGSIALAPANEFISVFSKMMTSTSENFYYASLTIYAMNSYYNWNSLTNYFLSPYDVDVPTWAESECLGDYQTHFTSSNPATYFTSSFITAASTEYSEYEPFYSIASINSPGNFTSSTPILLLQGSSDTTVSPDSTEELFNKMCQKGNPVKFIKYPGETHTGVYYASIPDIKSWVDERKAGLQVVSNCP